MAMVTLADFEEGEQPYAPWPTGSIKGWIGEDLFYEEHTLGHEFDGSFSQVGGNNPGTSVYFGSADPSLNGEWVVLLGQHWIAQFALEPANAISFMFRRYDYSGEDWGVGDPPPIPDYEGFIFPNTYDEHSEARIGWYDPWVADAGGSLGVRVTLDDMTATEATVVLTWWTGTWESEQTSSHTIALPHEDLPELPWDTAINHPWYKFTLEGSAWELRDMGGGGTWVVDDPYVSLVDKTYVPRVGNSGVIDSDTFSVTPPSTGLRYYCSLYSLYDGPGPGVTRNNRLYLDNVEGELGVFREEGIDGGFEESRARFT